MKKEDFERYLLNLKEVFKEDNEKLRKDPINRDVGIAYNRGYIACIENVLLKLKEVK